MVVELVEVLFCDDVDLVVRLDLPGGLIFIISFLLLHFLLNFPYQPGLDLLDIEVDVVPPGPVLALPLVLEHVLDDVIDVHQRAHALEEDLFVVQIHDLVLSELLELVLQEVSHEVQNIIECAAFLHLLVLLNQVADLDEHFLTNLHLHLLVGCLLLFHQVLDRLALHEQCLNPLRQKRAQHFQVELVRALIFDELIRIRVLGVADEVVLVLLLDILLPLLKVIQVHAVRNLRKALR